MTGVSTSGSSREQATRRHLLDGTMWGLIGEGMALPSGLATAAFLTRLLGTADYGRYALTVSFVMVLQVAIGSLLSRAAIKYVSQEDDWKPVATAVLRLHLVAGSLLAAAVALGAPWVAAGLGEPSLTGYLRLFALSLPVEAAAQGHIHVLVGLGRFRARALARAGFWIARLIFIVSLVLLGFGVSGALLGAVAASLATLALARRRARIPLFGPGFPVRPLLAFGAPLLLAGLTKSLTTRLDLFALKALGGSASDAGLYGSAQTLALVPGLLATAFAPLLLSSMNRAYVQGDPEHAHRLVRDFLRLAMVLVAVAAVVSGASSPITRLAYGTHFEPAGPILAILIFMAPALIVSAACNSVLIVMDRGRSIVLLAVASLVVAGTGFLALIPPYGARGAAMATVSGSVAAALLGLGLVWGLWRVRLPFLTVLRATGIAVATWKMAAAGPSGGPLLVLWLALCLVTIPLLFWLLGEFRLSEMRAFVAMLRGGLPASVDPSTQGDRP